MTVGAPHRPDPTGYLAENSTSGKIQRSRTRKLRLRRLLDQLKTSAD
jgi:hypothetical protein